MFNIHIPRYERIWLITGIATLVIFLVLFGFMGVAMNLNPPGHMQMVDPAKVASTPPFDNPGIREVGPNQYEVTMISQIFLFQPDTIELPMGAKVHFQITTPDVVHGMLITGTNVNMMAIPGHITQFDYTFDKPGEYLILCNEYCGVGHQLMAGRLIVR